MLRQVERGDDPFPEEMTLAEFAPVFLDRKAARVRPHTLARYRSVLEKDAVPLIGQVELRRLRPAHLQQVLDHVGARRSRRCVEEAKAVLSGLLKAAAAGGLVEMNVARGGTLEIPEEARSRKPPTQLAVGDVRRLLDAADGTTWAVPLNLVARLGLRRSEVLGLTWATVDLDEGLLSVTRGLHRVRDERGSRLDFLDPKSPTSARTISIGGPLVTILRAHRRAQAERRLQIGAGWMDLDLICDNGIGGPLDPDSMSTAFKRFASRLDLPAGVRLHDLRHAAARLALEGGAPLESVSRMLGHSTLSFTHKQYVAPTAQQTSAAVRALDDALGGR